MIYCSEIAMRKSALSLVTLLIVLFVAPRDTHAQIFDQSVLLHQTSPRILLSPASASFEQGATFDISMYLDTAQTPVNAVDLTISFDPRDVFVISPVGKVSIISKWISAPSYSNETGYIRLTGNVENGITTSKGLIATITFKSTRAGETRISVDSTSEIRFDDPSVSPMNTPNSVARITFLPKAPESTRVYSETHPFQDRWYNNDTPTFMWDRDPAATGYSYTLDDKPFTIPDITEDTTDERVSFPNTTDGVSYFHLRTKKDSAWLGTTHYAVRIDTTPPTVAKPKASLYWAAAAGSTGSLSFKATDIPSGINHYEIGLIRKEDPADVRPVFVEATSPYILPTEESDVRVIVRAFDEAGNTSDTSIEVALYPSFYEFTFVHKEVMILSLILLVILLIFSRHFVIHHHIVSALQKAMRSFKEEEQQLDVSPKLPDSPQ